MPPAPCQAADCRATIVAVSYFTAVIARSGAAWRAVPVDVEDAESLDELADLLRGAGRGGPVLAVLEREDDWFAFVRVDGEDEPRGFVSDLAATERSRYAALLAPLGDVELAEYSHLRVPRPVPADEAPDVAYADDDPDELAVGEPTSGNGDAGEPVQLVPAAAVAVAVPPSWVGDPGLLADVGLTAEDLVELVDEGEGDPASVVAAAGECCGFDELLDALR